MRYCPTCEAEYLEGFSHCADCKVELVDELPPRENEGGPGHVELVDIYSTGRRVDAELVRSMLQGHGLKAHVWAAGMGPWRMESALTEVTGVPNAFNAYRVMVPAGEVDDARALLQDVDVVDVDDAPLLADGGLMSVFRSRWALVAGALFLLLLVLTLGPPE